MFKDTAFGELHETVQHALMFFLLWFYNGTLPMGYSLKIITEA